MCRGTFASCFLAVLENVTLTGTLYPYSGYSQGRALFPEERRPPHGIHALAYSLK